ncbi:Spy/CpxP family protein refolding chaperone [Oscillatoria sp. FACHB-1407]|uniref:Spy/CpxP family protein refolding chaperone n=1 Tax=Oscillatoria sp. FACHB-1407 TaxID=2692847 RepID=UPI001683E182|nr:Spy/CpxP family protein refolding chaperone [Oscillatoria sp. FACHB-1407]MBD2461594.1 Spy/CpxP family protein refolding chaperone [Oscillatoria sp. FACHB-1407]
MKPMMKPATVLTGSVMAVVGFAAGLAVALHPMTVQAQSPTPMEQWSQVLEELDLTPDQQTQLAQIRENTRSELEALLTPDQREQFRTTLQNGSSFRSAVRSMNLSEDQRTQLRSIFQSTQEQVTAILTEEQRQQVRELIRSRMQQQQ